MLHKEAQLGEGLGVPSGAVWLGLRVVLTGEDIQGPVDVGVEAAITNQQEISGQEWVQPDKIVQAARPATHSISDFKAVN